MRHSQFTALSNRVCLLICTLATPLVIQAQGRFDPTVISRYGGSYAIACNDPAAPRLHVRPDALVFEQSGKTITGHQVEAAYSYFGNSPPPNYQVALMSEVKGGVQMMFIIFGDKQGQYITLEVDPKLAQALGAARANAKYRYCDGPRANATNAAATPAAGAGPSTGKSASPAAKAAPGQEQDPSVVFYNPKFKAIYGKIAGPLKREAWLTTFEGPASLNANVVLDGVEFRVATICKPHDCYDHNALFLFAEKPGIVYAKVNNNDKFTLIGAPTPAAVAELDRQWKASFRR
jgi:Inhibitor of vertebrate lysozyme (Ivy)